MRSSGLEILPFSIMLWFAALALTQPVADAEDGECEQGYALLDRFALEENSPKLAEFLKSPAIERLKKTQPESFRNIERFIGDFKSSATSYRFETNDFLLNLELKKSASHLEVAIHSIQLKSPKDAKKRYLEMRSHNRSLNLGFPRLLVALSEGIEQQLKRNPGIKSIKLRGETVVNSEITEQMKAFGFSEMENGLLKGKFLAALTGVLFDPGGALNIAGYTAHGVTLFSILAKLTSGGMEPGKTLLAQEGKLGSKAIAIGKKKYLFKILGLGKDWQLELKASD